MIIDVYDENFNHVDSLHGERLEIDSNTGQVKDSITLQQEHDERIKQREEYLKNLPDKINLNDTVKLLTDDDKRQKNIRDYYLRVLRTDGKQSGKRGVSSSVKAGDFYLWLWDKHPDLRDKIPAEYKTLEWRGFVGGGLSTPPELTEVEKLQREIAWLKYEKSVLKNAANNWYQFRANRSKNPLTPDLMELKDIIDRVKENNESLFAKFQKFLGKDY